MNNLKKYNEKRNFNKTKEPKGKKEKTEKKLRFVVQHHLARRDHYDLRLEYNGVLLSWAVPKGPSFNPEDKRLAVRVEDHPLSYRNFEGTIPKGEYGGGTVMLWDKGCYQDEGNFSQDLKKGVLKFTLKGKRLKGKWTLIHFKEDNWLLIKENDEFANLENITKFNKSIKTNRTMKEISENKTKAKLITSKKDAIVCGIKITNPDKVIFNNPKVTKLDIALYYHKVAKKMLPFIKNRLFSAVRMPDGVGGEKFFKKHFETNPYLGKKIIFNEKGQRNDYYYIKDEQGLIYEVQMNSYEFHVWGSKVDNLNSPDLMVLDLDPDKNLRINKLRTGVKDIKKLLKQLKLSCYLKTSGNKGYHIMIPIKEKISWKKFREIAKKIAEIMENEDATRFTSNI